MADLRWIETQQVGLLQQFEDMTHTSNLIMWSLRPIDNHILLFEAAIRTDHVGGASAKMATGVRQSYQMLTVFIHLN